MKPSTQYRLCLLLIGGGIAASFLHALAFVRLYDPSPVAAVGIFTPSVAALAAGLWLTAGLHSGRLPDAGVGRVLGWYLGGIVLFAVSLSLSYAMILPGNGLDRSALFSVGNWAISGSAVGLLLANYDLRRTYALQTARENSQRATKIAQRFSVLNRVLRHDIRNKLSVILGHVELLADDGAPSGDIEAVEDAAESLLLIADRARRIRQIIDDESPRPVNLTEYVTDCVAALQDDYPEARVTASIADAVTARSYPDLEEAIAELLENAIEHNPSPEADCEVEVTLRRVSRSGGDVAELVIRDNGPGIPRREQMVTSEDVETQLEHSRGTSLWLTRWIVDESDGEFEIETTVQDGSEIRIRVPSAEADSHLGSSASQPATTDRGR